MLNLTVLFNILHLNHTIMETLHQTIFNFLQSCVRHGVSTDDIGYLFKWAVEGDNLENYIKRVRSAINDKFFDRNRTITKLFEHYFNH